ncbi:hypothetical protein [Pontibacter sp. G13]|uniref:hypothetical protein n=1 Tax=Pontibacter sp. G13 TaxID=3074898 RepID=UPI002889AC1B|nr:hypothetical protein [Pontibacter sp. G13]WNJ19242.1 hypothetical protein RJD25_02020 [Pontibacter sp. G13]
MGRHLLIAESGATKTDWVLSKSDGASSFRTQGLNPSAVSPESISQVIQSVASHWSSEPIHGVHFYGAGCGTAANRHLMTQSLSQVFGTIDITVGSDLEAAVRSAPMDSGIAGILGTGSHSCEFRNYEITTAIGGHGYLLGDEGSGADLGRHFIAALLRNELPDRCRLAVESHAGMTLEQIKRQTYKEERPNAFLGQFTKPMAKCLDVPPVKELVVSRFRAYVESTFVRYEGWQQKPLYLVGSVAYFFQAVLTETIDEFGGKLTAISKAPIDGLRRYHGA